jgi:hypothetical protein
MAFSVERVVLVECKPKIDLMFVYELRERQGAQARVSPWETRRLLGVLMACDRTCVISHRLTRTPQRQCNYRQC